MSKQDDFLDRLERILERHADRDCGCDPAAGVQRAVWCDPCPPLPPVRQQYEQTLARFNDQVSATAATAQATQQQMFATWGAQMLKLQSDITSPSVQ